MAMHSSLRSSSKKGHRSVLKRFERLPILMEKDKWDQAKSVFGLPKVKTQRAKIKKEKAAVVEAAAAVEGAAGAAQPAAGQTAAKPQASTQTAKPELKKEEKKK